MFSSCHSVRRLEQSGHLCRSSASLAKRTALTAALSRRRLTGPTLRPFESLPAIDKRTRGEVESTGQVRKRSVLAVIGDVG